MAIGDGPAVLMGQRVQHGVVGVHGGQAVPLQLLPDDGHQLLHASVISPLRKNRGVKKASPALS
ncbi:hypothetical protein E2C01_002506 [Portunus trituberculatus]|uniref:Uncharacterized protein n=1 Tax=Portunus trituberculatus TaxID=210409 RepID=A0A5B7CK41_PORTR|nr:hypothetical protein [Portunus trituberculatus]